MVSVLRHGPNGNPLDSLSQDLADGHARNRIGVKSRSRVATGSELSSRVESRGLCLTWQ